MPRAKAKVPNPWDRLIAMIEELETKARADEMRGGGDPDIMELIELEYKVARERLDIHIRQMRRDLE